MLKALLRTFEDESVLEEAVAEYLARAKTARPQRPDQLSAVEADIRKSENALDPAHRAHLEDLEEIAWAGSQRPVRKAGAPRAIDAAEPPGAADRRSQCSSSRQG